ncbi:helix-turn-helix domain-containing protein [Segnochrobactrum spirostomi]|uniref:Helix-turn-helix transcriptional regulator n=1 Tax=Segnochrobactrum spirostomi TaxID=2608987 RepID=A0A6A7Y5Y6_9HYPH|nr:helix-turn-helix transcriptional regulator [Segnochrobactrum spirostomi]MQT14670.1 helix-turn-helix transcriptional regulator [Segnochrobactrum spirostomi]
MTIQPSSSELRVPDAYPIRLQPIAAENFARRLKTWRHINSIKQAALAQMLGVSQATISFWESGRDMPSRDNMRRLHDLMARSGRDETLLDRLFVKRQSGMRALFDFDGVRLLTTSQGFRSLWPDSGDLESRFLADHLVDEAQHLAFDREIGHGIMDGSLGVVTGVSDRHMNLSLDVPIRHRWHMCFRRYGYQTLVDVVYEPCLATLPKGISDLVHLGD